MHALGALGLSKNIETTRRASRPDLVPGPTVNDAARDLLKPTSDLTDGVDP